MTSVVSEYITILQNYRDLYGDDTVVLMQVGSFYEMYGVDNEYEKIGNAAEVSRLLNIVLTKRNKRIGENSRKNPLMLGFPCLALSKYLPILLEDDYTIVIVDQVKTGLSIKREVVSVVSPSTYIEGNSDEYTVLIHVERVKRSIHVGMSAINVMTGKSIVHECHSAPDDEQLPLDGAVSFVQQHRPREIVLSSDKKEALEDVDLVSYFGLSHRVKYCYRYSNRIAHDVDYQNMVLGNVWANNTMLSNIELLDLELRPSALISYVLLIEYIYAHNPMLIKKISMPQIFVPEDHLILATNTIEQLNIVHSHSRTFNYRTTNFCPSQGFASLHPGKEGHRAGKKMDSVLSVIDNCSTIIGKRLLRSRLLSPIHDPDILEERYTIIDEYGAVIGIDKELDRMLGKIADLEKLQRRISLEIMSPNELASMLASSCAILDIHNYILTFCNKHDSSKCKGIIDIMLDKDDVMQITDFIGMCERVFDVDNLLAQDMDNNSALKSIFKNGIFLEIDNIEIAIQTKMDIIQNLARELSSYLSDHESVKIEFMQNAGYYLSLTNARTKKLKELIPKNIKLNFKYGKVATKITSHSIDQANVSILDLTDTLRIRTKICYKKVLGTMYRSYGDLFNKVMNTISELDVLKSNYKTATLFGYCRPVILKNDNLLKPLEVQQKLCHGKSFIRAHGLRHPIIERADMDTEYVPSDIEIGTTHNGMVLYSMNAAGKTSLLKACGISVILAQMGSFVPASSYHFYPFRNLITRIISEDNLLRGRSSFVAEMHELRSILKRADNSTLVLADEITHGTEHTSGSAIFVSSVMTLAKRHVNFMFTTHLHNVYQFIRNIKNVKVCHLSVKIVNTLIIFERKICDGPGDSIYGLEVCNSLQMDEEFLAMAFKIRDKIECSKRNPMLSPLNIKKSRYNTGKLVQLCEICRYSPRQETDAPLDVHHITYQCTSDSSGMIPSIYQKSLQINEADSRFVLNKLIKLSAFDAINTHNQTTLIEDNPACHNYMKGSIHKDAKANLVVLCKQCHFKVHKGIITIDGYINTTKGVVLNKIETQ